MTDSDIFISVLSAANAVFLFFLLKKLNRRIDAIEKRGRTPIIKPGYSNLCVKENSSKTIFVDENDNEIIIKEKLQ